MSTSPDISTIPGERITILLSDPLLYLTAKDPLTLGVLYVCIVSEGKSCGGVLLVLLVVHETSEMTTMPRELAKYELISFISRQRIHKLEIYGHTQRINKTSHIILSYIRAMDGFSQ